MRPEAESGANHDLSEDETVRSSPRTGHDLASTPSRLVHDQVQDPAPASGLGLSPSINMVDREHIASATRLLDSSIYYGPMGQMVGLPLVNYLDAYMDEPIQSRGEVHITNVPNEPTGEVGTAGAGPPRREGPVRHLPAHV